MNSPRSAAAVTARARLAGLMPRRGEALLFVGILGGLAAFLLLTGVAPLATAGTFAMIALQPVAGFLIWRVVRPDASALESVGMTLAIGTALAGLIGSLGAGISSWAWLLPTATALVFATVFASRFRPRLSAVAVTTGEWWAFGIGLALAAVTLAANLLRYPLTWTGSWGGFHPDMIFFEALSRSIAQFGPWESIFTPGERILYHWLAYGWSGQITVATGAEPLVTLTRTLPYVTVVAGLLLVISWSRTLSSVPWVPTLAAVLFLLSGHVGVVYGSALNFDSPSQSMSAVWIVAWSMTLFFFVRTSGRRKTQFVHLALLVALGAAVMLAKSSAGAVLVCSAVILALFGVVLRADWTKRAVAGAAASSSGAVIVFLSFIWGSQGAGGISPGSLLDRASSLQGMNPIPGREGIIAGTALVVLAISLRWASLPFLAIDPASRRGPHTWFAFGLAMSALGGVIVFNGGQNELWFAAAAIAPLATLSAVATAIAWSRIGPQALDKRRLGLLTLGTIVLTAGVWVLWLTGPSGGNIWQGTLRWAAPLVVLTGALVLGAILARLTGGRTALAALAAAAVLATATAASGRLLGVGTPQLGAQPPTRGEFSSMKGVPFDFIDPEPYREVTSETLYASVAMKDAGLAGLVATNVTSGAGVPAFSGRQTLVSGTWYQAPYGPKGIDVTLRDREEQSWGFFLAPSKDTITPLCDAGVETLWIDLDRVDDQDWSQWGRPVFVGQDIEVWDIGSFCLS